MLTKTELFRAFSSGTLGWHTTMLSFSCWWLGSAWQRPQKSQRCRLQQNRHPEALSRIRAHLEPGNDDVRCLSIQSIIRKSPHSAWTRATFPPSNFDNLLYGAALQASLLPCGQPQSTGESSASKRRTG